jgi:hypothetical protein
MLDVVWPQVEEHAGKLVCLSLDNNLLHRVPASLCHFHQLRWLHLNECAPGFLLLRWSPGAHLSGGGAHCAAIAWRRCLKP